MLVVMGVGPLPIKKLVVSAVTLMTSAEFVPYSKIFTTLTCKPRRQKQWQGWATLAFQTTGALGTYAPHGCMLSQQGSAPTHLNHSNIQGGPVRG